MRCDIIAEGIIAAARELELSIPIVVRLQGKQFQLVNLQQCTLFTDDLIPNIYYGHRPVNELKFCFMVTRVYFHYLRKKKLLLLLR